MVFAVYVGPLEPDVEEHLEEYKGEPFDVFESYYEIRNYDRIPPNVYKHLGKRTQMDWGSWLQTCDRQTFRKLFSDNDTVIPVIPLYADAERVGRQPPIPAKEIPDGERYGFLEVELE